MSPADVMAEHGNSQNLKQNDIDRFLAAGVPPLALGRPWGIAKDRVCFQHHGLEVHGGFEFERHAAHDDGSAVSAFIFLGFDEFGEPADLVAWRAPLIASWQGRIALLGQEAIYQPRLGSPLIVHSGPLSWLKASRDGVVMVNPRAAEGFLYGAAPLACHSHREARDLRRQLTIPPPQIEVVETLYNIQEYGITAPPTQPEHHLVLDEVSA